MNITRLNVIAGEDLSPNITMETTDVNAGDRVTYALGAGSPPGLAITPHSGVLTWVAVPANITANDSVRVIATDGKASAVAVLQVNLCGCKVGERL